MNSDFSDLLQILGEEKADYLIVGGYAVGKHAEPRYTKDIDIWIRNTRDNAERVYRALARFGAPIAELTIEDLTDPDTVFQMGIEPTRIDILMGIGGVTFEDCWQRKVAASFGNLEVWFISLDDLIENKRIVSRPQDLIDVDNLRKKKGLDTTIAKPLTD